MAMFSISKEPVEVIRVWDRPHIDGLCDVGEEDPGPVNWTDIEGTERVKEMMAVNTTHTPGQPWTAYKPLKPLRNQFG